MKRRALSYVLKCFFLSNTVHPFPCFSWLGAAPGMKGLTPGRPRRPKRTENAPDFNPGETFGRSSSFGSRRFTRCLKSLGCFLGVRRLVFLRPQSLGARTSAPSSASPPDSGISIRSRHRTSWHRQAYALHGDLHARLQNTTVPVAMAFYGCLAFNLR